jgi:2-dehydropantoate 2-reductase
MKVCIYGAGAIGGWIGVRLAKAGHDVSVVARGATLDAIGENGLQLIEAGETHTVQVSASDHPSDIGVQDLVVIAVKAPAMASVADGVAPLVGPGTGS